MTSAPPTASLAAELLELVGRRVPPARAALVQELARAYVRRIPSDIGATLTADELAGHVLGLFELADGRGSRPSVVRAFNPSPERDGYATAGSVIETNCDDIPFLVDSVSEELAARKLEVRVLVHPVVGTERDERGRFARIEHAREAPVRESLMHFEVDRRLSEEELAGLAAALERILSAVQASVRDFTAMTERIPRMVETARAAGARYSEDEVEETELFLWWLLDGHFVFLGYREYSLEGDTIQVAHGQGLGILSDDASSGFAKPVPIARIDPALRDRLLDGGLLVHSKTNSLSPIHRRVRMDDVTVKRVDAEGRTVGALRVLGLLTAKAYMAPASRIPILSRKLRQIAVAEDLLEGSHDYKQLVEIFDSFPKDELFAASAEDLRATIMRLVALQERRRIEVFVRPDLEERSVGVLVALPRDRFTSELRQRLQTLLVSRFHGISAEYHLALDESDLARLHFLVHVDGPIPEVSFSELEQDVLALARTWDDRLRDELVARYGEGRGQALADRYSARLPDHYKASTDAAVAVADIAELERLELGETFAVGLVNEPAVQGLTRVSLYKTGGRIRLSDVTPILAALGLTIVEEVPTRLTGPEETFIHDFGVLGEDDRPLDLDAVGARVADCIAAVWGGEAESDSLNRLVVTAGLTWRQVQVLRAYRTYRQRAGSAYGVEYENAAYARNPGVAAKLVDLFELVFDPGRARDPGAESALRAEILADLDAIPSLDEDRILRAQLASIDATVRTNAFRPGRSHLSFKLVSERIPDLPKPRPAFEVFVYSAEMEGIHLRGGKVARGGIRFSDRREDYRTEILGLMKAQMVKNAVIVPVGAKGGFVLKRTPADAAALRAEVETQYSTLIRGLLDVTDNLVHGETVHPPEVRVLDADDPYLVVAADKGTATFSDLANAIAAEYGFWLGDAFASGGSSGYDHKALGITARGVWESVRRHFRELGRDADREPVTVVGIGDMSGDVFGNGMLLSRGLRLVAAFDHRHVFIDPDPDPEPSYDERERLFKLPSSSWADYDRSLLSAGGGVWSRSEKRIPLAPEARRALGLDGDVEALTPAEVISAILRAPVDLLWNGGIGTFVKSSAETHADVADRANDPIRVDGSEVRARVVAEGGNLGFTQKARIEYARSGGRLNTDAVDNSAGVDCSDHEVNLKILLGLAVERGELSQAERNELARRVEGDVARHVLYDNYLQAQILSQEEAAAPSRLEAYEDLMLRLEGEGILDRELESLPSSDEMAERSRSGAGMARPELCVLLALAKQSVEEAIRTSPLADDPYLDHDLREYFPPAVVERFGDLVPDHPLRRELASTLLANRIVNDQGITFVSRLVAETGADAAAVARAHRIAREVTDAQERWAAIEALDGVVDPVLQNELMVGVDALVESVARWYLLNAPGVPLGETIAEAAPAFAELALAVETLGSVPWRETRLQVADRLAAQGVPAAVARHHAFEAELAHVPDMLRVARATGCSIADVADAFFAAAEALSLDLLEGWLEALPAAERFTRWAAHAMGDELMALRRDVAARALAEAPGAAPQAAVERFLTARAERTARLDRLVRALAAEEAPGLAALTVAVRQVRAIAGS